MVEPLAVNTASPEAASPDIDWYKNMFLYVVDWPFSSLFVSVSVTFSSVILFLPSIIAPSEAVAVRVAFLTVMSAVE